MRKSAFLMTCLCFVAAVRAAEELPLAPREGVLLLHNGQLIQGTITPSGDRYDVQIAGGVMYIKRADVALLAREPLECYQQKRTGIEVGRVQDHLELAQWCLKNNLLEQAERELTDAKTADPTHPKIRLLEPRLQLARQSKANPPPVVEEKSATSQRAQLDRMVRTLPNGSVETFTNTIQPLLINYCGKSGCHGPQATSALKLERIAPNNRFGGRHLTQLNLQSVLGQVNLQSPDESKLLEAAIQQHGTTKGPVFSHRNHVQMRQLIQWVYRVARTKSLEPATPTTDRGAPLLQTLPVKGQANATNGTSKDGSGSELQGTTGASNDDHDAPAPVSQRATNFSTLDDEAAGSDSLKEFSRGARAPRRDGKPGWLDRFPDQAGDPLGTTDLRGTRGGGPSALQPVARSGEPLGEYLPKDPFDPETFNRRFLER